MNSREKLNEIRDPDSAEWTQWLGASVDLTVVASVVSSLCFLCLHLGCPPSPLLLPAKLHDQHIQCAHFFPSSESAARLTSRNLSPQHKQLQPQGAPNQPVQQSAVGLSSGHARLNDSFDAIRQEFDAILQDASILRSAKEEADAGRESLSRFLVLRKEPCSNVSLHSVRTG